MIVKTKINNIDITAGAFDFAFIGASVGAAEGEAIIYGIQHAIDNQTPFVLFTSGGGMRMFESLIALSQMTRTTLAINELKKNKLFEDMRSNCLSKPLSSPFEEPERAI